MPLPPIAQVILSAIAAGTVAATVSNAEIGQISSCHQRTACRHLGTLARRGTVRIERIAPNPAGPGSQPTGHRVYAVQTLERPTRRSTGQ